MSLGPTLTSHTRYREDCGGLSWAHSDRDQAAFRNLLAAQFLPTSVVGCGVQHAQQDADTLAVAMPERVPGTGAGEVTHLPSVEAVCLTGWEEEHIDELDEDAGGLPGRGGRVHQPLIDDHEEQVAKDAQHEEQLRDRDQEDIKLLPEVPAEERAEQVQE